MTALARAIMFHVKRGLFGSLLPFSAATAHGGMPVRLSHTSAETH